MKTKSITDFDVTKSIYIDKSVNEAMKAGWEALYFPDERHVFVEAVKDKYIFRIVPKGLIALRNKKTNDVIDNKEIEKITDIVRSDELSFYDIIAKNHIAFEVLKIIGESENGEVVTDEVYIKENYTPGATIPFVISNFLLQSEEIYMRLKKIESR